MKTILIIKITLIYLSGLYSSTPTSNQWAFSQVQSASGLPMKVVRTIKRRDFDVRLNNLNSWQQKFFRVKAWVNRQKTQGIKLAFAPPLLADGRRYIAGLAERCKPLNGVALVYANDFNQDGADRKFAVQCVAAHELGHLALGMSHDNSLPASLMHEAACHPNMIRGDIGFSENSKQQIRRCVR